MAFELRVTFTGLNLFLVHTDGKQVAVLQPDARKDIDKQHEDESDGREHVGYLRFDLINAGINVPPSADGEQRGEGVVRFDKQTLHFGLAVGDPITVVDTAQEPFPLPNFSKFTPPLEVHPDLLTTAPTHPLVMRTILRGGTLKGALGNGEFVIPQVLSNAANPQRYQLAFRNSVTWTRTVPEASLRLTLHDFVGARQAEITLRPLADGGPIRLKISNLCSENPLEWNDFTFPDLARDDEDFKWMYRLLRLPGGVSYRDKLLGSPFPIPRHVRDTLGVENCIGGILGGQTFPDFPAMRES